MIYVLVSSAFIDYDAEKYGKLIKIGYTGDENKDRRLNNYLIHNPTYKLLYIIPKGTEELERLLHSHFIKYRFPDYGNEWFYWDLEIIDFFETYKTVDDLINVLDQDLVMANKRSRFNGFKKFSLTIIDTCLNLKMSSNLDYTLEKAMIDRDICFQELDNSKLILKEGVFKFILDYFSIPKEEYDTFRDRPIPESVIEFIRLFNSLSTFYDKMRAICESSFSDLERKIILEQVPITFKNLYNQLGPIQLKACGYNITNIRKRIETVQNNEEKQGDIKDLIYKNFNVGEKYSLSYIKTKLGELYREVEYLSSPKAIDLEEYFEIKKVLIPNKISNRRDSAYEILRKKE